MMLMLLAGCPYFVSLDETGVLTVELPKLEIEAAALDFGEVSQGEWQRLSTTVSNTGGSPMGLELDAVGTDADAFCVHWEVTTAGCGDAWHGGAKSHTGGGGGRLHTGRGSGDADTAEGPTPGDTGGAGGRVVSCPDGSDHPDAAIVLEPGCSIAAVAVFSPDGAGPYLAGMRVVSVAGAPTEDGGAANSDPRNFVQHVRLDGVGVGEAFAIAGLAAHPASLGFAWRWPDGASEAGAVQLVNTGNLPLTLDAIDASGCPEVTVTAEPGAGSVLAVGGRATIELVYTPVRAAELACQLQATTAEGAYTRVALGSVLPRPSHAPILAIVLPTFAERVASTEAFEVTIDLGDDLQPPSALDITYSSRTTGLSASGNAPDDSGRASFVVPAGSLLAGPDTLIVSVRDLQGNVTTAAVPVRVDNEPVDDADGDAWGLSEGDCDDANAATFPGAAETANAADDDCDTVLDEGTSTSDDDGDGFSEADGDFDDSDARDYPGAVERLDGSDNDGDGLIDDGTSNHDDDGDGFSEFENDCDDIDPAVSPVAPELCDGLDNNCNALKDSAEGLVCDDRLSLAYVDVTPDACAAGETVELELVAFGVDASQWGTDASTESGGITPGSDLRASLPCPERSTGNASRNVVHVSAATADGHQAWADAYLFAYPDPNDVDYTYAAGEPVVVTTACNPAGPSSAAGALVLMVLATAARRRPPAPGPPRGSPTSSSSSRPPWPSWPRSPRSGP